MSNQQQIQKLEQQLFEQLTLSPLTRQEIQIVLANLKARTLAIPTATVE
jgi:hypothetical protein